MWPLRKDKLPYLTARWIRDERLACIGALPVILWETILGLLILWFNIIIPVTFAVPCAVCIDFSHSGCKIDALAGRGGGGTQLIWFVFLVCVCHLSPSFSCCASWWLYQFCVFSRSSFGRPMSSQGIAVLERERDGGRGRRPILKTSLSPPPSS